MMNISKGKEPAALTQYKSQPDPQYDGPQFTSVKDAIRQQLLDEQGYLCAYCMGRIDNDQSNMKIEHWHSQKNYPAKRLDYKNMLAVCCGNEGDIPKNQHCDTKKADQDLCYQPTNPNHDIANKIAYLIDGTMTSNDALLQRQLEDILNLNYFRLKRNREKVLKRVKQQLGAKPGTRSPNEIKRLLQVWQTRDRDGKYQPYCGVAIHYLKKKLSKNVK